jgi:hypothetical protein
MGVMRFLHFLRADLMHYSLVSILGFSAAILLSSRSISDKVEMKKYYHYRCVFIRVGISEIK